MKILIMWSFIPLAAAVLILASCTKAPPIGTRTRKLPVSISSCDPSWEPLNLKSGGIIEWDPKDYDYTITFDPKIHPKTHVAIPVPGPLSLPKGVKTDQTLNLPDDCTPKGCYFKYNIFRGAETLPCYDPGIHIVP